MSYDLDVYAPSEAPFDKSELKAALQKRGWNVIFLHQDAFWNEKVWPFLSESGSLDKQSILLAGWPLKNALASQLETLVQSGNFAEFKQLVESTLVLATCSLSSTSPYNGKTDFSDEEWKELEHNYPEAAAMQSGARSHYYLNTSGGRSPWAIEFQHAAWEAIAEITAGVAENPQGDTPDWEELTGEKMGLGLRLKTVVFDWRYRRARKKYGLYD